MKKSGLSLVAPLALAAPALGQIKFPPEWKVGVKWQIEIQHPVDGKAPLVPADAVVWDVDLYHLASNPGLIDHLRTGNGPNTTVICYFNAGLVQESDCDWDTVWNTPAYRGLLGQRHPDFPDEAWINIRNQTARDLIKRRIDLAREIGCDGVDPDNIDGYGLDEPGSDHMTGWNLTQQDDIDFILDLATYAHRQTTLRGNTLLIGQKNAPEITRNVSASLDFAVLEDCRGRRTEPPDTPNPFCTVYQDPYIRASKPVFSIEYPASLGDPESGECSASGTNDDDYTGSCQNGVEGFSEVLKIQGGEGELNGCTEYCDVKGLVVTTVDEADGGECPSTGTAEGVKGDAEGEGDKESAAVRVRGGGSLRERAAFVGAGGLVWGALFR